MRLTATSFALLSTKQPNLPTCLPYHSNPSIKPKQKSTNPTYLSTLPNPNPKPNQPTTIPNQTKTNPTPNQNQHLHPLSTRNGTAQPRRTTPSWPWGSVRPRSPSAPGAESSQTTSGCIGLGRLSQRCKN